jgi:putative nucleotidyltransferase with HDIG domain
MANIMENLTGRYQEFIKLTVVKKYDVVTFTHLLNVSILSLHFSSKLGFTKDDCLGIGIAGLFHDIGKLQISRSIIKKKDKLTEEEFMAVKSHTVLGAEILLGYVDSLGIQPAVVAFEHHLRYDNKGYPKLTFATKPHIGSSIVSICDVYDALIARRTYKRDYPPKMVYDLMMRERSGAFMPSLLDSFFRVMGVWPQGTIVELNTGDIAIVRQEQEEDIFSPLVEVVSSQKTGTFIDLKKEKDKITIERSLNPFSEGKQYISFL